MLDVGFFKKMKTFEKKSTNLNFDIENQKEKGEDEEKEKKRGITVL